MKEYILNPANKLFLREDVANKDEYGHVVGDGFDPLVGRTLERRVSIPPYYDESSIDPPKKKSRIANKKKRAKRGAVGKLKKVRLRELIFLQIIIFYVYQMFNKVDDADIADEGTSGRRRTAMQV